MPVNSKNDSRELPAPETASYQKSGYLHEDFRIFHNADGQKREIPLHYHDFHKLVMFLSGNVSYAVEGRQYDLQPLDVVAVAAGQIHRPLIHDTSLYERIVIYISSDFFAPYAREDTDLFHCFSWCQQHRASLIRLGGSGREKLAQLFEELKSCASSQETGAGLLRKIKLMELLLTLNKALRQPDYLQPGSAASHPLILQAMDFINTHLTDESLCVDLIAKETALGRSYLMHLFKAQTGCTVGEYIREKRLFSACTLIEKGYPVTEACYRSGFGNYAAFYYAYRKKYASAPANGRTAPGHMEGE